MNQNQIGRTVFDIDEESDAFFLQKAIEYHEWLPQQEAQPRLTRTPIFCDREDAERRLRADYSDDHCNYTANPLPQYFHFFISRLDCTGRMSISALMKCTTAIRQFAYGSTTDAFDEYLKMSEHTARDALFFFNMCIVELYMPKYLKKPTTEDVVNIQQKHNNVHGFSRMLGSIDCMQWKWKNCPVSWQAGANNDINVLDNSPLFDDLLDDLAPVVPYVVNGVEYRNGYYLADGIYPEWASFVKSFTVATDPKHTYFKQLQESARKVVERAFGVLQGRWDHLISSNMLLRLATFLHREVVALLPDINPVYVLFRSSFDDSDGLPISVEPTAKFKEILLRRYYNKTCEYPNEAMVEIMLSRSGKVVEVLDWKKDLASETKQRHEAVNDIKRALIFVMMEGLMLMEVRE
nr:hypothetical protein [Tanacetum cinerariifolium]